MPLIATYTTKFSRMLRESGSVLAEVERRDVLLERRDGPDVMLVDAEREQGVRDSLEVTARFLAALPSEVLTAYAETAGQAMPWMRALPVEDRAQFLAELTDKAQICLELGVFEPLGQLIHEWRTTAAIWADPDLMEVLRAEPDTDEPVRRPDA